MAPRPSSASIGYRPSCVVLTARGTQYGRRYPANLPFTGARDRLPALAEDAQRQVEGNSEVGLVHDLADPKVAGQAAQDVGVLAAQLVVRGQPRDGVADGAAGVLHEVRAERANRVVAGGIAAWLQELGGCKEVIAPRPQPPATQRCR